MLEYNYGIEENIWLAHMELIDAEWYAKYIKCYFWSLATMITVGKDGVSLYEDAFVSITLMITVSIFGYIISKVGSIID